MYFFDGPPAGMPVVLAACQACPLAGPCAEWALQHEEYGVWGGLYASQRVRMRQQLGITLHAPPMSMTRRGYPDEVA